MRSPALAPSLIATLSLGLLTLLPMMGCSTTQTYASGQSWQRNECQKMPDAGSRSRCLEAAGLSAEAYRRETEAAKAAR